MEISSSSLLVIPLVPQLKLLDSTLETAAAPPPSAVREPSVNITIAPRASSSLTCRGTCILASSQSKSKLISVPLGDSQGGTGKG